MVRRKGVGLTIMRSWVQLPVGWNLLLGWVTVADRLVNHLSISATTTKFNSAFYLFSGKTPDPPLVANGKKTTCLVPYNTNVSSNLDDTSSVNNSSTTLSGWFKVGHIYLCLAAESTVIPYGR